MSNPPAYQRVKKKRLQDRRDLIDAQVADGTLVIRKMTKAELKHWGPVKDEKAAMRRARRKALRDAA